MFCWGVGLERDRNFKSSDETVDDCRGVQGWPAEREFRQNSHDGSNQQADDKPAGFVFLRAFTMAGCDGHRAVVTGVGVVSPIGIGKDRFWDSLVNNRSGIDFLGSIDGHDLPSPFAAEVRDFDPAKMLRDRKFIKVMSRDIQLGVASAQLAMKDTGLAQGDIDPYRLGVVYGAGRMTTHPSELLGGVEASLDGDHKFSMTRWGEGGMGRVYLAEQKEPVERRVALKLALHIQNNPEAKRRFLLRRRALHSAVSLKVKGGTSCGKSV